MTGETKVRNRRTVSDKRFARRWLMFVGVFLPITALWALSNPLFAAPDETTHMVRAQGIAAGSFSSPFVTDGLPIGAADCLVFQYDTPASCQDLTWDEVGTSYPIPTTNSPSFFFVVAAAPAVVTSGLWGAYIMRLWLACLCVALLAWAGALLTRPGNSPWLLVGLCLAVPPMSIFIMSSVNPSGLSAAASVLLVAGLLAVRNGERRAPEVIAAIALGAVGLVIIRREGVISLAVIAVAFAPLLVTHIPNWRHWFSTWRQIAAALAGVALLALMTLAFAGPTLANFIRRRADSGGTDPWEAATYIRTYLIQVIGNFGWLETPIGDEGFLVAMIVAGFVVILGLLATDRRGAASTALALSALLVAPVMFGVIRFPYLQGRYLLPIWVCLMLVAATATSTTKFDRNFARRATSLVLIVWLGIHVLGFLQNVRRYTVGRNGSWGSIIGADWQPPMMTIPAALFLLVVCVGLAVILFRKLLIELEPNELELEPIEPEPIEPEPIEPEPNEPESVEPDDVTEPTVRDLVWSAEPQGSDVPRS